jgi:excisionase family DNA binding protein
MLTPTQNIDAVRLVFNNRPFGVSQAAARLGIPERTIRHWARTGRLRAFRDPSTPKLWRFHQCDLATWQEQRES